MSTCRKPSLQALETLFADRAAEALALLSAKREALIDFITARQPRMALSDALALENWHELHELRLEALNLLLDGSYGVERIELQRAKGQRATVRYLNTGDTYSPTVVRSFTAHDGRVSYRVTTWGDEVERLERLGYGAACGF